MTAFQERIFTGMFMQSNNVKLLKAKPLNKTNSSDLILNIFFPTVHPGIRISRVESSCELLEQSIVQNVLL